MKGTLKRSIVFMLVAVLSAMLFSGCGNGITEETKKQVMDKSNEALELYANIERLVEEHKLTAEQEFIDMKEKLTTMSAQIKERVEDTTEEDGKLAAAELDKIITNLQSVKKNMDEALEKAQPNDSAH